MSDLFGNHIVGFPTRRLISCMSMLFDTLSALIVIRVCSYLPIGGHSVTGTSLIIRKRTNGANSTKI